MHPAGKFLVAAPPDGRALWLRHDGLSINLMASTCFISAGLVLPVDDCFEVRILRVDRATNCLYVRPLCGDNPYDEVNANLSAAATAGDPEDSRHAVVSQALSMSTVYMLRTKKGYLRAILLKREKATMTYSMYGIDLGEVYDVSANDVNELLPSLRNVPPLCLRVVLESCCNTSKCDEFELLDEGTICTIKICNEFPSNYPQRVKEMYPPAIMSQIYRKSENGKFVEITCTMKVTENISETSLVCVSDKFRFSESIGTDVTNTSSITESIAGRKAPFQTINSNIGSGNKRRMGSRRCRALVVKSASVPAITRDPALPFMFRKFSVLLPAYLIARVTERTDYDTYLMRNPEILDDLAKCMVVAKTPLKFRLCLDRGICCIAQLIRPARSNSTSFQPQTFRAIANQYRPDDNTCEVLLVDFGQTIICSVSNLFELQDQPIEVLEKPTASFRCRVKRFSPSKRNGNKGVKLLDENDYSVCLTLKCTHDLYWAKVTLSDTDFVLYYKKLRIRKKEDERQNMKEGLKTKNTHTSEQVQVDTMKRLEQRQKELNEEKKRLHEMEEMLKKEKENFADESIKREHQLQLIALQMQLWDISAKLDMVTSNNSNFMKNCFYPQMQQSGYCDLHMHTTNSCTREPNGCGKNNFAASTPQQRQNATVNQSLGQQWSSHHLNPNALSTVTPKNQCDLSHHQQQMNRIRSSMPYIGDAKVYSNAAGDYHFGISKYNDSKNNRASSQKWCSPSKKWQVSPLKKARAHSLHDTFWESNNGHSMGTRQSLSRNNKIQLPVHSNSKHKKRTMQSKIAFPILEGNSMISKSCADHKVSLPADSFWDSCHRKMEYGEPPQRTISDYCNIAKKRPHEIQDNFPKRSLSVTSQYNKNLSDFLNSQIARTKLEHQVETSGDAVALDSSHTSLIKKPIYTSDESADNSQLYISSSSYEEQEMLSDSQIPLHVGDESQSFPTYQVYHKLISIVSGSELIVRRVGSEEDWPVFFITPTTALQQLSAACFDPLYPTRKLNADEIAVGALCAVQCNGLGKTKVRALIEHFSENAVHVRHIDDGHLEIIRRNELWSIENLSPSVRTQPALAVPCILASLKEMQLVKTIECHMNAIPCVGQLMRVLFKEQRNSDGIWIVELINEMYDKYESY